MKYILLSDFLRAPAKTLDIAIAEEAYIVSLHGMQCAYRVRRVDDPNDLSHSFNHPQIKIERIGKSNLLASRESVREMLNTCHLVMIYKHRSLEITMERMPFDAADYPEDSRVVVGKTNQDGAPATKRTDSKTQLLKKAVEKDVKRAVDILAGYLLPAKQAKRKEAKQPLEELVVSLVSAAANAAIIKLQQE